MFAEKIPHIIYADHHRFAFRNACSISRRIGSALMAARNSQVSAKVLGVRELSRPAAPSRGPRFSQLRDTDHEVSVRQ
jgi:hypothetical protein